MCTGRVWKQKETTQHILSTFVLMLHKVKTLCMHIPAREEAHKTLSLHTGQTMIYSILLYVCVSIIIIGLDYMLQSSG